MMRAITSSVLLMLSVVWPASGAERLPALQRLADDLSQKVAKALPSGTATVPNLAVAVEAEQNLLGSEGRLTQELERLLLFRLEAGTAVERAFGLGAQPGGDALERARQSGASWLLRCVIGLKSGKIHVAADLTPAKVAFWDRLVDPAPRGSLHHLFAVTRADAEIELLLGSPRAPPVLGSWHLDELLYVPWRILDLGAGDLDGTPGDELVLMSETAIEVYTIEAGAPKRLTTYPLEQIPAAEVRTRDPAGSLLVRDFNRDGKAEIFYKQFNHRFGEILTWSGAELRPVRRLRKVPLCQFQREARPVILFGEPETGTNRYRAFAELTDVNASEGQRFELPDSFQTVRCWQAGADRPPVVIVIDRQADLHRLGPDWQPETSLKGVGAGSGVLDLDLDGHPELVLSEPVWPGQDDGVRVLSRGEVVWRSRDVLGGVVAVAGGDPRGAGKIQALLAAVEHSGSASRVYLLGR